MTECSRTVFAAFLKSYISCQKTLQLAYKQSLLVGVALWVSVSAVWADGIQWSRDVLVAPESGTGSAFSVNELSLDLPMSDLSGGGETLLIDLRVVATEFRWTGTDAGQNDYYWVALPMDYQQKRGRQDELRLLFEPGLMTDPDGVGTDRLAANLAASWRHYVRPGFFWELGVLVDRRIGDLQPRPLASVAWKASDTEVLLGFPDSRIQTRWNSATSTYLHYRPAGGVWRETIKALDQTHDIRYRTWRLGMGAEVRWRSAVWLNAELGTQKLRHVEATDSTGAKVSATPAQSGYWLVGLLLRW